MRSTLLFAALGLFPFLANSQQVAQYSLFLLNPFHQNPAYAGMDFAISATAGARAQWVGLEGSPDSRFIDAHAPFEQLRGGIGFQLESDRIGAERNNQLHVAYSYQKPMGNGILAVGIGAGLLQKGIDGNLLRTPGGFYQDQNINHQDITLPQTLVQGSSPSLSLGLVYQMPSTEIGLSVRQLNQPSIDLGILHVRMLPSAAAYLRFNLELNRLWSVHPALQLQTDGIQYQTNAGLLVKYNNSLFLGATLRGYHSNSLDAVCALVGTNLGERWKMAYAYDISLSPLQQVNQGSHEIALQYILPRTLGARKQPKIIYNPRNL